MTQSTSKLILGLEAFLLVTPVTFLYLVGASDVFFSILELRTGWFIRLLAFALASTSLVTGWWLMVQFWRHGAERLSASTNVAWVLVLFSGIAVVAASILVLTSLAIPSIDGFARQVGILVFGLPLLVPLAHLWAERRFRSTANTSLERSRAP